VLLESVEGGLAYPLMLTEVGHTVGPDGGEGLEWGVYGVWGAVCSVVWWRVHAWEGAGLPAHAHSGGSHSGT
jgi:hypothetical protein